MKQKLLIIISILSLSLITKSQNVVIVIIDGARYSETFGDPNKTYIPNMFQLSQSGAYCDEFYNNHLTYTSQAIPALWSGSWDGTRDTVYQGNSTQYSINPSIFEYFRKQKDKPETQAYYILKYVNSLWLQSFHSSYGPDYWPATISLGDTDNDVLANSINIIENEHPQLLWIYLADVDHAGHSGDWDNYTSAIENADNIVNQVWQTLQADSFYKDNTVMFVTNDHGRHDDSHGGFSGHGCSCEGCRHIMFLAIGKNIKENYISYQNHETTDLVTTVSSILDINPEYSSGIVVDDIFVNSGIDTNNGIKNVLAGKNNLTFYIDNSTDVSVSIYDIQGREVRRENLKDLSQGKHTVRFNTLKYGVYLVKIKSIEGVGTYKFIAY